MPEYPFKFERSADVNGEILLNDEYNMPIDLILRELIINTTSNCDSRDHPTSINITNSQAEEILRLDNEVIADCEVYNLPINDELNIDSGTYQVVFKISNFIPNENVKGEGRIRYGFSFPIAKVDGIYEKTD